MQVVYAENRAFVVRIGAMVGVVSCLVGVAGCGPKSIASTSGTVSGTVTFEGVPVNGGMVLLAPSAEAPGWSGEIGKTGGYVLGYIASGTYKVWLSETMSIAGLPSGKSLKSIPQEYLSAATTPLSVTVRAGATVDFPIAIGQ